MLGTLVNDLKRVYEGGDARRLAGCTPCELFELYTAIKSLQFGHTTTISGTLAGVYKSYGFKVTPAGCGWNVDKP